MPKIVDKEQMQENILKAGLSAFLKHGFHNTTMIKIAKEAGIAKGTLYLYFDSKESLTQTITDEHFKNIKIKLISMTQPNTVSELLKHIEKSLLISKEESQFIPVFFELFGSSMRSTDFVNTYGDFFDEIGNFYTQTFETLLEKKVLNTELNPKVLGRVFVSMLDGIVLHQGFFDLEQEAYEMMVKESLEMFRRGIST